MPPYASSKEDSQGILYQGRATSPALGDICAMFSEEWRQRLAESIKESGRSDREISLTAGVGKGYVHSILKEGKDPSIDNLLAICNTLKVSASWIIYGVNVTPQDEQIIAKMQENPELRDTILNLLQQAKAS